MILGVIKANVACGFRWLCSFKWLLKGGGFSALVANFYAIDLLAWER